MPESDFPDIIDVPAAAPRVALAVATIRAAAPDF
jgi:hypothetical protein